MGYRAEMFTDEAQQALAYAHQEGRRLGHCYVGTELLLIGLLHLRGTLAARALGNLGFDEERARAAVEFLVGKVPGEDASDVGLTPRLARVVEFAIEEANQRGRRFVGVDHLLLGLTRDPDGISAEVLAHFGLSLDQVRVEALRLLAEPPKPESAQAIGGSESLVPAPPPSLRELRRVVPMGEVRRYGDTTLLLLALELYADGFVVTGRVLPPYPNHAAARSGGILRAVDDRGNQYQLRSRDDAQRDQGERFAWHFTAAVDPAARALSFDPTPGPGEWFAVGSEEAPSATASLMGISLRILPPRTSRTSG